MIAYVDGDAAAFRALFDRYALILHRLVRRKLATDDEARDVVQQALLHLHRARNDFRRESRLRPWLFTIAMNLVREHHRRRGRRREHPAEPELLAAVAPLDVTGLSAEQQERALRVRAALASLPEQQREVIELHWFEECPYEDIAPVVGASVAAVRVRAHRGYERLRKILADDA